MDDLPVAHVALRIESGKAHVRELVFDASEDRRIIIGRSKECDVSIPESGSSRKHAMLIHENAGWLLHDLASTNGTILRGRKIARPTLVAKGDVIAIGSTKIHVLSVGVSPHHAASPRLPAKLEIDLVIGQAAIDGETLPLSAAELIWFAHLATNRRNGDGWVIAGRDGHEALRAFAVSLADRVWARDMKTRTLAALTRGEEVDDEDLKNLRAKTMQKLKRWSEGAHGAIAALVVPEVDGRHRQRIPLPPEAIAIAGEGT